MTKPTHRVERKIVEFEFDEEAVREAFLAGERPYELAVRIGGKANHRTVYTFIKENGQVWLDQQRYSRLKTDARKIVMPIRVERAGGFVVVPVSVARTSMQAALLGELAHA